MKLILLHLSDIHFKESKGQNPVLSRTEQIAAAAASIAPTANCCFLAVTGDVAFSGKQTEYTFAGKFFKDLRKHLGSRLPDCNLRFVLVPGNHDCDFSEETKARELLLSSLTPSGFDESVFTQCAKVQGNYEEFAAQWRAESIHRDILSKVYTREIYDLPEGTVEFRLINSAWMSTLEEDQGSLLFPVELLRSDKDASPAANLVITILHHPYNWFEATNARDLRDEVEKTSDIILTGHEHDVDHYRKDRINGGRTEYLEGAVLQDSTNPNMSMFNVLVIDLDEQIQTVHTFSWDSRDGRYEPEGAPVPVPFQRNLYRLRNEFLLEESFEEFLRDAGAEFTHPEKERIFLDDLFVYPDLRELGLPGEDEWITAVIRDQVPTFVLSHRHVFLIGQEKCGKTALSKVLFQDLRNSGFVPIYVRGSEFKGYTESSISATVERSFKETYASPDVNAFRQLERTKKAIIVDDFHKSGVNARGRDRIINTLETQFDVIVLFGDKQLRFDNLITQEGEEFTIWDFAHCEILPFGYLRRADLIKKWYFLGRRFTHDERELFRQAVQAEKTVSSLLGRNFIPSHPIFIITILQLLEANIPVQTAPTCGSYGFLYESLLTMALARSSRLNVDLNTQYNYLSEFAYFLFKSRVNSVSTDAAFDWHQWYCKAYSERLDFEQLLSGFCEAAVLCIEDNTVSFQYLYMYYYFVGRYFRDHIGEEAIQNHISSMSKRLHHTESANILLFLSYLSRDPLIISSILEASRNLFLSYHEFDLAEDTEFLRGLMTNVPQWVLDSSHPEERRRKLLALEDELEAAQIEHEENGATTDESVKVDGDLREALQINVAFKTIQILGQILRNFAGSLKGQPKLELAEECYSLGLRVLKFMFDAVEADQEDIVQFLAEFLRSRHPAWSYERLTDQVASLLFNLLQGLAFVVVKHISDSVGSYKLSMTFDELLGEADMMSYRFIDLSIRLDYYHGFPNKEVFQLYKDVQRNPFSPHLLRHLVWYYFYIYPARHSLRKSVCAKLDIKLLPAAHDQRAKRLKA